MSDGPACSKDHPRSAASRSALDWVAETVGNDALLQELRTRAVRRRRCRAVACATAALALIVGFVALRPVPRGSVEPERSVMLQVSRPGEQVLPDGSRAELREGARLQIDFSDTQRRVTLRGGDAHFSVHKDPARPFIVHAEGVEVRAVGTAFAVQMVNRGVEVLVTEGTVAVDHPVAQLGASHQAPPLAIVVAGQGTVVTPKAAGETALAPPTVAAMDEAEMMEKLSWRIPRLELSGTPLETAVEAFNRHSKVKLVIGDPSLARLQVSGIVRADQADALVSLLAANFNVAAEVRGDETVLVRRAR